MLLEHLFADWILNQTLSKIDMLYYCTLSHFLYSFISEILMVWLWQWASLSSLLKHHLIHQLLFTLLEYLIKKWNNSSKVLMVLFWQWVYSWLWSCYSFFKWERERLHFLSLLTWGLRFFFLTMPLNSDLDGPLYWPWAAICWGRCLRHTMAANSESHANSPSTSHGAMNLG